MTDDELRLHFDLKRCLNPAHDFRIGRLSGGWVWASDNWSQLVGQNLQTLHFAIHSTTTPDGITIHSFTAWKLKVVFGVLK